MIWTKIKAAADAAASVVKSGYLLMWPQDDDGVISLKYKDSAGNIGTIVGGSGGETPYGTVYSGTVSSGAYVADYSSGDIHTVSSPSDSSAYTVSSANIPVGRALVLRIDNATGSVVTCDGTTVIEAADVGAFLLTFANITGLTKLVSKLTEA